jgi:transposase
VTLSILWEEYIAGEPGGFRYSRFCELYRAWEARLSVTMRQSHAAGDKLFVDYAGDGVPVVIDRRTGERRSAQIFVAVLGASSLPKNFAPDRPPHPLRACGIRRQSHRGRAGPRQDLSRRARLHRLCLEFLQ